MSSVFALLCALLFNLVSSVATPGPVPTLPQSRVTSRVDLAQIQFVVPGKVTIGKTFRVLDEVENQGESLAFQTVTGFYLSVDDVLDDGDIVVGGRRAPQLGSNQSHSTTTPVTLKPDIKPGDYYLLAVADAKRDIEERTRENNVRAVRITVLPAEQKKKK